MNAQKSLKLNSYCALLGLLHFLTACQYRNEPLSQEMYEETVNPYIFQAVSDTYAVKHFSSPSHEIQVLLNGKVVPKFYVNYLPDIDNLSNSCSMELYINDLEVTEPWYLRRTGGVTYAIHNQAKLNNLNRCVKNYLDTTAVNNTDALYVLADDRIRNNLDHELLKKSFAEAFRDEKLTYTEMVNIYKSLDQTYKDIESQKVDQMIKDVRGSTDFKTVTNRQKS